MTVSDLRIQGSCCDLSERKRGREASDVHHAYLEFRCFVEIVAAMQTPFGVQSRRRTSGDRGIGVLSFFKSHRSEFAANEMIDDPRSNPITQDVNRGANSISAKEDISERRKGNDGQSTYKAQSMAKIIVISFAGMFTADMTRSMVTRPAEGIDAAPTEATVAVKLRIDVLLCPEKLACLPHDH